jgi:hypothetical protein
MERTFGARGGDVLWRETGRAPVGSSPTSPWGIGPPSGTHAACTGESDARVRLVKSSGCALDSETACRLALPGGRTTSLSPSSAPIAKFGACADDASGPGAPADALAAAKSDAWNVPLIAVFCVFRVIAVRGKGCAASGPDRAPWAPWAGDEGLGFGAGAAVLEGLALR